MATRTFAELRPRRDGRSGRGFQSLAWLALALLVAAALPGCGGCATDPVAAQREAQRKKLEEERKKKEKPKPNFESDRMLTQPNNLLVESSIKPGHWTSATFELIANNYDFVGEVVTDPFELERTPFRLGTSRPAALPKGQKKHLEVTFYVPPGRVAARKISMRLLNNRGSEVFAETYPTGWMRAHQFYFFVLAKDADQYGFLRDLDSVTPPLTGWAADQGNAYYRVVTPKIKNRTPLPTNPLTWTSVAYVLWDDLPPDVLTPDQQQAMLDWLHWGGQLIISGPGTLDGLRGSFLADYLPAAGGEPVDLSQADLVDLSDEFSPEGRTLALTRPWSGQKLLIDPDLRDVRVLAESGNGEPLIVERRTGRGNIVVTAFRLSQRELRTWGGKGSVGFDSFLNACLLRRGPRQFEAQEDGGVVVHWDKPAASALDPERVSAVNYFSRDARIRQDTALWHRYLDGRAGGVTPPPNDPQAMFNALAQQLTNWENEEESIGPGVAGWEDFNLPAELARQSLRTASGIEIPKASFVVWVLGVYLAVLVPLNWGVFRIFRRVELAWVAAPVITLAFAGAVIRLAQLDIGFARSRTELAVVEFNGDYNRAHVTRYTALYTSLSTSYDLKFEDKSALVLPFAPFKPGEGTARLAGQRSTTVNYRRAPPTKGEGGTNVTLEGFEVASNSLGMLHSEHMWTLDEGPRQGSSGIVLGGTESTGYQVVNHTLLSLEGATVVWNGRIARLGTLGPGGQAPLEFESKGENEDPAEAAFQGAARPELELRPLLRLALTQVAADEMRLVAWTADETPGLEIEPLASQFRRATLVVAHLNYGPRAAPVQDTRTRAAADKEADSVIPPDLEDPNFVPLPPGAVPGAPVPPAAVPPASAPPAGAPLPGTPGSGVLTP